MRMGTERECDNGRVQLVVVVVEHYERAFGRDEETTRALESASGHSGAIAQRLRGTARGSAVFLWRLPFEVDALKGIVKYGRIDTVSGYGYI